jgi:hypothetical protein
LFPRARRFLDERRIDDRQVLQVGVGQVDRRVDWAG